MKEMTEGVPIAVVEQETGLSKDLLRKWEARYNYPVPARNKRGDRIYSRAQIARLRVIKRLLDQGYRPSHLLAMDEEALARLAAPAQPEPRDTAGSTTISELLELLKVHQPAALKAALTRQLQAGGLNQFVQDTMAPLTMAVGEAWSRDELRVFEEHLFSDIATAILRRALDACDSPDARPRILMTTLPGEMHALGLLMAACLFTLHGAHCIYLGTETPGEEIAQAVQAHRADCVALSFSSAFPVRQIRPALTSLRQQVAAGVQIVAGGAGVTRQKSLHGIRLLDDFGSIGSYVAEYSSAKG